jgi:hypothetical protein
LKERKNLEVDLLDQLEYITQTLLNNPRSVFKIPDTNPYRKSIESYKVFEDAMNKLIVGYKKNSKVIAQYSRSLREQENVLKSHVDADLISSTGIVKEKVVRLNSFKLQQESLSRLESEVNTLFNLLATSFKKSLQPQFLKAEEMKKHLELIESLKNCAEQILSLVLASTLVEKQSDFKVNPFRNLFTTPTMNIQNVLDNSNLNLAMNTKTIAHIMQLIESDTKPNGKPILELLLEFQGHEMGLQLSKHFESYENQVLRNLLRENMEVLVKTQREVEESFAELEGRGQDKFVAKVKRIEGIWDELKRIRSKDQRRTLKQNLKEEIAGLRNYVSALFRFTEITKAKQKLESTFDRLKKQRYFIKTKTDKV